LTTTIYYYTATGNSLMLARAIAQRLGDTEIVPLARHRMERTAPATRRVGIIFPIHAWGLPRTVAEFVDNLNLSGVRYAFAVASCNGTAAGTLPRLRKAIRKNGGDLHAGFIVRSPSYSGSGGKVPPMIAMVKRLSGKPFPREEERLPAIIDAVGNEQAKAPDNSAFLGALLGNFFHSQATIQFAGMDAVYSVNESCVGCGQCSRICPRGNVTLQDGKPAWRHDCDFCGACITWCPRKAIMSKADPAAPHGHHPGVTAADLA
jgi:ferredoxin